MGYAVKVIEQNPVIITLLLPSFNITTVPAGKYFNYLVLKGYLEREQDRRMPVPMKEKKRTLKPKFIKEIIEELTEDYDLPAIPSHTRVGHPSPLVQ